MSDRADHNDVLLLRSLYREHEIPVPDDLDDLTQVQVALRLGDLEDARTVEARVKRRAKRARS